MLIAMLKLLFCTWCHQQEGKNKISPGFNSTSIGLALLNKGYCLKSTLFMSSLLTWGVLVSQPNGYKYFLSLGENNVNFFVP